MLLWLVVRSSGGGVVRGELVSNQLMCHTSHFEKSYTAHHALYLETAHEDC